MTETHNYRVAPPGTERRSAVRYPCRSDNDCRVVVSDRTTARWGRPRDISLGGIGLSVSGPFAPGSLALLEFPPRRECPAVRLVAQVTYSAPQSDGSWAVGCSFDSVSGDLDAAERAQLLEHFRAPPRNQPGQDQLPASLALKLHTPLPPLLQALKRPAAGAPEEAEVGPPPLEQLFDLLLLSRGRLHLQCQRMELGEPLVRALETVPRLPAVQGRRCTSLFPMETMHVHGDPARLAWACSSLLAVVARHAEGEGSLWLAAERDGLKGLLRVGGPAPALGGGRLPSFADILTSGGEARPDAEHREQVCLALVRGLIDLHGGTVECRTARSDTCSEFVMGLPLLSPLTAAV